jgi:hypothetical protein
VDLLYLPIVPIKVSKLHAITTCTL